MARKTAVPTGPNLADMTSFLLAGDDHVDRHYDPRLPINADVLGDLPETDFRPVQRWELARITQTRR